MNKLDIELRISDLKETEEFPSVKSFYIEKGENTEKINDTGREIFVTLQKYDNVMEILENNFVPEYSIRDLPFLREEIRERSRFLVKKTEEIEEISGLIDLNRLRIHFSPETALEGIDLLKKDLSFRDLHGSTFSFKGNRDEILMESSFFLSVARNEYNIDSIAIQGRDPMEEYRCCTEILRTLGEEMPGPVIVSCPTCSRTELNIIELAKKITRRTSKLTSRISIAIMGCEVNGPGEAAESDVGIAGGCERGLLFSRGKKLRTVKKEEMEEELIKLIEEFTGEECLKGE